MYGLSTEDLAIQTRARGFADELIPFEEQAEAAGGELPADLTAGHAKRARELGLHSTNMPAELGGGGCGLLDRGGAPPRSASVRGSRCRRRR